MEASLEHSCIYHAEAYPEGYEFHGYLRDMVCKERAWHELDEESSDSKVSLAYIYH